jgi:hypothetical protein
VGLSKSRRPRVMSLAKIKRRDVVLKHYHHIQFSARFMYISFAKN